MINIPIDASLVGISSLTLVGLNVMATIVPTNGYTALTQGGAFVVLCYAFLHLLIKVLPQRDKEFTESIKIIAKSNREAAQVIADTQKLQVESLQLAIVRLDDSVVALRTHCASRI